MSWKECIESNNALRVTPDKPKADSLASTAEARINFFKKQVMDNENCSFFLEAYYTSTVELLHALLIKQGLKVLNHVCLGAFLKDVLKREDLFTLFDSNRKKRKGIVYYGELVKFETARRSVKDLERLIKEIKRLLKAT